ncbi:MAG: GTPase CgtA [Candidatus Gottesmanbacteria bacterium GW2011_GWC2_39_8]|uniref:GTPase CgtA n=1 Tax=Candidatus Gottesmanbacteria bacterium GW2011_GWC2_39_8 TaxID=1618450 RepID=A0A0G0Q2A6_9BACT|nr:MAG: GTPase CgtA [Candidatus Gottesmanbacteria bacterium GW2011_GWC2_39_8]
MLIDELTITFKAGDGGRGKMSFYHKEKAGPDGGNGGDGGNLYVTGISDIMALDRFGGKPEFSAEDGNPGESNQKSGRNGKDRTIELPIGTVISDLDTGDTFEIIRVGQTFLLCEGGRGGKGNYDLRSSRLTTPKFAEPGTPGVVRRVNLSLKIIADFGLIGLPSSGKTSLLNALTNAHGKVAAYPFTTLSPNLGVYNHKIIADVPGLIEGAAKGRGLGDKFLKHIERVKEIFHCISVESDDPAKDYQVIRKELEEFSPVLKEKKERILLTKIDLVDEKIWMEKIEELKKLGTVIPISIYIPETLVPLKKSLDLLK